MTIPFFYINQYDPQQKEILLDEDTSRHIVQVLRMKPGEEIHLTDGKGNLLHTTILDDHKKHCRVSVNAVNYQPASEKKTSIGISLLKNTSRFEWFLEKATEMGVNEIIPIICTRTEKEKFRPDRLQSIVASAMLQSQQCWLPLLHQPIAYELLFRQEEVLAIDEKYIAHCIDQQKKELSDQVKLAKTSQLILIGPEGDFTPEEIELALAHHCVPVSLGQTRLRTETAGIYAAAVMKAFS